MSKCKSCGAEIIWITMASGKKMPVNAQKISYSENLIPSAKGKDVMTLVTERGSIVRTVFDPDGDKIGYISHFATCPAADAYRKRDGD